MLNGELLTEQNRKKHSLQLSTIVKFLDGFVGDINDADTRHFADLPALPLDRMIDHAQGNPSFFL